MKAVARLCLSIIGLLFALAGPSLANSFRDDSHYVSLGPRTGYYVVRDTSDPLRHGYGADVLAFRFNQAGRLIAAPAYIANAQLNEFYTRRVVPTASSIITRSTFSIRSNNSVTAAAKIDN